MLKIIQKKDADQHDLTSQSLSRFLLFSMVVLAFFAILNFSMGLRPLAFVDALVLLTLPPIYSWLKTGAPHGIIKHIIGLDALVIFLPLIFIPTAGDTGIYWMFGYPMLVFFFLGTRTGFLWISIYFVALLGGIALSYLDVLTLRYTPLQTVLALVETIVFTAIGYFFTSDREKAERIYLHHLHHLESIDKFETELRLDVEFDQSINRALELILEIITPHRVWLLYPCDPDAPSWKIIYEKTVPEFSDAKLMGIDLPSPEGVRKVITQALSSNQPLLYDRDNPSPLDPSFEETFSIKSQLLRVLRPDNDQPWLLGLHYCSSDKPCSPENIRLFQDIANRFEGRLNQLLLYRELQTSEADLRSAIKQAEAANHAKSEFLSVMSHELRTPLHGIIGLQNLIAADANGLNDEQRENLLLAQQSAKSLRSLVNDVLDIAKIESGNMVLVQEEFLLFDCIRDALVPFILFVREKAITLSLNIDNVPAKIIGDESRLRQVLLNLVGNAVKFTHEGKISVQVHSNHDLLYFSIKDSGIGIPTEKIETIFEPFTQLETSSLNQQRGTGLGTSIVKRFVELMDGNIQVESSIGKGSCFTFQIPYHPVGVERISHSINATQDDLNIVTMNDCQEEQQHPVNQSYHIKALLAEDDPIGQRIAIKQLSRVGIEVDAVNNGKSAWKKIRDNSYDLLLTDLRMPGMSGIELTQKIRTLERDSNLPHLPIIGLSAHALDEVAKECSEAGMDHFMTKPVDPETILSTILMSTSHKKSKQ
ncbi:MAG: ATP-binding protein [Mariprofundaceae bacterium]